MVFALFEALEAPHVVWNAATLMRGS